MIYNYFRECIMQILSSINMLCVMQVKQINCFALVCQRDLISRYDSVTAENIM